MNRDPSTPPAVTPVDDFVRIDAEEYRYLAEEISATMDGRDAWDDDAAESYILAQYVKWLAAGRPVDAEGYPDKRPGATAGRPDTYGALRTTVEALDLAESYFDNMDGFRLSMQGVLSEIRDSLVQIRDALIGHAGTADPDGTEPAPDTAEPVAGDVYQHRQDGYRIVVRTVDQSARRARTSGTERTEPVGSVGFDSLAADFERVGNVGPAGTVGAPHVHFFPLPPDPSGEPGDCACGRTYADQIATPGTQTQKRRQPGAAPQTFTLDDAARLGGVERLTGGAITGPVFSVDDDDSDDDA